jgi:hypothetical protein
VRVGSKLVLFSGSLEFHSLLCFLDLENLR